MNDAAQTPDGTEDTDRITLSDAVRLGAVNPEYFCHTFFPRTFKQPSPPFYKQVWAALESNDRFVNIQMPRGYGKTSILRAYTARRIAYGLAHTVLYIGRSEAAAIRSVNWLRTQLEHNRMYTHAFNLRPGTKQQDVELNIWHGTDEYPIWIMAAGITGSIRGINRDDFRPDLIILDDVLDDENCLTDVQRQKLTNLIYGAVAKSLAPETESPDAKLVMNQTPLHPEDASTLALTDPMWRSLRFSCWTPETENLPVARQVSAWPQRYPSETLRTEKRAYAAQNRLSVFARESECKLVAPETCAFKLDWLQYYDMPPDYGARVLVIDPVPPPSESQLERNLHNNDYECLMVVQRTRNDYYVLEYVTNRGHNPEWTIAQFFTLCTRYNPRMVVVETVAYQRTLAWLIRRAMEQQGRFWAIREHADQRPKYMRIIDSLTGIASARHLHVQRQMSELIEQFQFYKNVQHDDVLECCALGVAELNQPAYDFEQFDAVMDAEDDLKPLVYGGAP